MFLPFRNRLTGDLFNEKYSFPVGRDCTELYLYTSVCRSGPVWLFQTPFVQLRAMLPAARAMLRTCTCMLCATDMLRSLQQATLWPVFRYVQKVLPPPQLGPMLPGSGNLLCASIMLCASRTIVLCSSPGTLLRHVIPSPATQLMTRRPVTFVPVFFRAQNLRQIFLNPTVDNE